MKNLKFRYLLVGIIAFVVLFCNVTIAQKKNLYLGIETLNEEGKLTYKASITEGGASVIYLKKTDSLFVLARCFEDLEFTNLSPTQPVNIEIARLVNGKYTPYGIFPNDIAFKIPNDLEEDCLFITTKGFSDTGTKSQRCLGIFFFDSEDQIASKKRGF